MARKMTALQRAYFGGGRRRSSSRPRVTVVRVSAPKPKKVRRRRRSGGGGMLGGGLAASAVKVGAAGVAAGFISAQPAVASQLAKLPVIGNRAITVGLAGMAVDAYVFRNKYLRLGSLCFIAAGALQLGRTQGGAAAALEGFHGDVETVDGDEIAGMVDADDVDVE